MLSTNENDSVSENGSGNDEGKEENVETEGVVAEEEEALEDKLIRYKAKVPRGKSVMKKRTQCLLLHLFLEMFKILQKNVIYLQFLQGNIKKGKEG